MYKVIVENLYMCNQTKESFLRLIFIEFLAKMFIEKSMYYYKNRINRFKKFLYKCW